MTCSNTTHVRVHYLGFHESYDEWQEIYGGRIRAIFATRQAHEDWLMHLGKGQFINVRGHGPSAQWSKAVIMTMPQGYQKEFEIEVEAASSGPTKTDYVHVDAKLARMAPYPSAPIVEYSALQYPSP